MTDIFKKPNVTFTNIIASNGSADGFLSMPIEGLKIEMDLRCWTGACLDPVVQQQAEAEKAMNIVMAPTPPPASVVATVHMHTRRHSEK
jgi:hypothetical protein